MCVENLAMPRHHLRGFFYFGAKERKENMAEKRFQVLGWTRRGPTPKESDGVEYDLGQFDLQKDAEEMKRERLRVGWGRVVIIDRNAPAAATQR